jgi:hypothetical protein
LVAADAGAAEAAKLASPEITRAKASPTTPILRRDALWQEMGPLGIAGEVDVVALAAGARATTSMAASVSASAT